MTAPDVGKAPAFPTNRSKRPLWMLKHHFALQSAYSSQLFKGFAKMKPENAQLLNQRSGILTNMVAYIKLGNSIYSMIVGLLSNILVHQ